MSVHVFFFFGTSAPRWLCFPSSTWPTLVVGAGLLSSSAEKERKTKMEQGRDEESVWRIWSHCQGISISSKVLQALKFSVPTFLLTLFSFTPSLPSPLQCFSRGLAHSIHLPQGSRCWVSVQMFCVYHSPITSLTNSHTVNIYRGVSSPLLPQCTEKGWHGVNRSENR